MPSYEYYPACDDIVEAGEPCECVFVARGAVDAQGVLHTARRVPADIDTIIAAMPDELAAVMPTQVDQWLDCEVSREAIIQRLVGIWRENLVRAQRRMNRAAAGVPVEFLEFDDGAHWRESAAWLEPSRQPWLNEPGGESEDWLIIPEPTGEDSERAHLALSSPYANTCW